ncbi:aminotransferase class I/II-fold pyridoxal phosphate-dependent enzyme [Ferruginivarius sediminum]|uniref:aspartate transaminase n=1 Tax=Ferruginivarius sediminum TaxID=2661937 RepID=A0A369T835_9PROT|nr:aminotransferase class I/II-fold pyridoxal phosphate-dependent enzyme [Ferruginivarius sediminum]RDD61438.1 aminotransferase class I/II-fold pyridoxal phosphate-dependent enzyme [Ferruginivarius sediminum]
MHDARSQATPLTNYEWKGMHSRASLADGHAYHDIPKHMLEVIEKLPQIWDEATGIRVPEAQSRFREAWEHFTCETLALGAEMWICPTASNSIDLVAAILAGRAMRTGLLEPTFDNLALLFRRRGAALTPIPEADLSNGSLDGYLDGIDAIFVVDPNNPTGSQLDGTQWEQIIRLCADHNKTLIVDRTFRFFSTAEPKLSELLAQYDVPFMIIEDTGKTWPTLDLKMSPVICSQHYTDVMSQLYQEMYLCASPFAMLFFHYILSSAPPYSEHFDSLQALLLRRRDMLRAAIAESGLRTAQEGENSCLPIEWLDCSAMGDDDSRIVEALNARGVHLLPGYPFFWSQSPLMAPRNRLRVSLLKKEADFQLGVSILKSALASYPQT